MNDNNLQCDDPHLVETFHQFSNKKLLILGHGGHGKDTVAEFIRDTYNMTFESSSREALEVIWPALNVATGGVYAEPERAYQHRQYWRAMWKELISLYNTPDKATLARLILSKNDMYVGMRCDEEYEASRELFDHVLWVDASERLDAEPSMKIKFDPQSMIHIDNNGSKEDLQREIEQLNGIFESWNPNQSYAV